jgi:hypothetical protein
MDNGRISCYHKSWQGIPPSGVAPRCLR